MQKNFMKIRSASKYCDISVRCLRELIRRGHLSIIKPPVGPQLLKREELDSYLDSCRAQPDADTIADEILAQIRG